MLTLNKADNKIFISISSLLEIMLLEDSFADAFVSLVLEYCTSIINCGFFFILIRTNVMLLPVDKDLRIPFIPLFADMNTSVF